MLGSLTLTKRNIALILLPFILSGCMGLNARSPSGDINFSPNYNAQTDLSLSNAWNIDSKTHQSPLNNGWWQLMEDDALNDLMHVAFADNPNLNQIRARLEQAQAQSNQSRAAFFPTFELSGGRNKQNGDNRESSRFNLIGAASYELDLWGENSATYRSGLLQKRASQEDVHTALVTLSATIAEHWFDIISLNQQERIIRKQIQINEEVLELQETRFEMGASRALDILQQREILAQSQARLPDIVSAKKQSQNNLMVLIGKTPSEYSAHNIPPLPAPLPIPDTGIPSELLESRADIRASWLRLISADWAVKAAFTDRLPRFSLSASYTTSATKIANLFETWLVDLASNIAAPIIDGGLRKAEQLRQEAIADERYHAYRETVLNAINDVENALVRNAYQDKKVSALVRQYDASQRTLDQAQTSYANGNTTYINVLNSLNNTQALEQQVAIESLLQLKERVRLYRALGGRAWSQDIENTKNDKAKEN